jgi:NAD(P)-dependent dehydrogenase (short-subunit alcohol dehydrogenase family)
VYGGPYAETADGFERTFGVCYLGHVRLVDALLPRMRPGARVVAVSSENHRWPTRLDPSRLPPRREDYSELRAYGVAKLCVNLWTRAFARRSGASGVTANALHPGDLISTGIDRDSWVLRTVFALARPFTRSPAQAAATSVWVATAPELEGVSGRYYVDRAERPPSAAARDDGLADHLWDLTRGWLDR